MRLGSELIVATKNAGKAAEFARMFAPLGIRTLSLLDVSDPPEIVEDGETFRANARKKADAVARRYGKPALADDSGLCVDALGGAPGVYSARYAGERATDADNNRKLLADLADLADRSSEPAAREAPVQPPYPGGAASREADGIRVLSPARFVCVLALVNPADDSALFAEGECRGAILDAPRGSDGFGYDPLFYLPEFGRTMAELGADEKNRISHRGRALGELLKLLQVTPQC